MLKEPPSVHVTVGVTVSSRLSVAVSVAATVAPEATVILAGLKDTTGASVSCGAVMETVSLALPLLPAASKAVAVHVAVVSTLTAGAV